MQTFYEFYNALNESKTSDQVELLSKLADKMETVREKINTGIIDLTNAAKKYDAKKLAAYVAKVIEAAEKAPSIDALEFTGEKAKDLMKILATGETSDDPDAHTFLSPEDPHLGGGEIDANRISSLLNKLKYAIKDRMSELWNKDPENAPAKAGIDNVYSTTLKDTGYNPIRRIQKRYGPKQGHLTTTNVFPTTMDKFVN